MPNPSVRALVGALACVVALAASAAPSVAGQPPIYEPPVEAPVSDPFRPPATPYGPGNRGIEYDTTPGTPVRVIGPGVVTFAGEVAGALHVTVRHADGLRSSYSFLATIAVASGQRLDAGAVVGESGELLHLGVRHGSTYIDPASLFGRRAEVRLVALDDDDGARRSRADADADVAALAAVVRLSGSTDRAWYERAVDWVGDRAIDAATWVRRHDPAQIASVGTLAVLRDTAGALLGDGPACTASHVVMPTPRDRVAVLVGGLGSTSADAAIDDLDTGALGYDAGLVLRFSYAGGRTPDPTDALDLPAAPYVAADTQVGLDDSARKLAALIADVARTQPSATIDVLAHSQGGVVARLAIEHLVSDGLLPPSLGLVVSIATPHHGAPLADVVAHRADVPVGDALLELLGPPLVGLDPDGSSPAGLSTDAPSSAAPLVPALPEGTRWLALGARGDVVVPAGSTALPGATNVVVGVDGLRAHDAVVGSDDVAREIALALAGLPPACESRVDRALDALSAGAIALGERLLVDGLLGFAA